MNALGLPKEFVIYDLEWTAWEGSQARQWSGPDEYREIYDIGAVKVGGDDFATLETFHRFVTLELVPELPQYSVDLTGITQKDLDDEGMLYSKAIEEFAAFANGLSMHHWGGDSEVIAENCKLKYVDNPFAPDQCNDIREVFRRRGIAVENYMSSTITEAFGQKNERRSHQGTADALNIVDALRLLEHEVST